MAVKIKLFILGLLAGLLLSYAIYTVIYFYNQPSDCIFTSQHAVALCKQLKKDGLIQ